MRTKHFLHNILGFLSTFRGLVGAQYDLHGSYFALRAGAPLVSERLDPIIQPGKSQSNHVHDIYGASNFGADWTYEKAIASRCNNMGPVKDHSNYWFPALYHQAADGTFTRVQSRFSAYYRFDTADNGPRVMFPKGFKIVAGNPMLRHNESETNKAAKAITWFCDGTETKVTGGFPEGVEACPGANGFSGEIWLPFCWDGLDTFDPTNPSAHVVYGDAEGPIGGKCSGPEGKHTKPLPQLFLEFHHDISAFAKPATKDPWVLAPGDPTGYGFHADFINGWEDGPGSLEEAMQVDPADPKKTECYVGLTGQGTSECFEMLSEADMAACKIEQSLKEDVDGPFSALPGCNPIQGPSDQNAVMRNDCGATPSDVRPSQQINDTVSGDPLQQDAASLPGQTNPPSDADPRRPTEQQNNPGAQLQPPTQQQNSTAPSSPMAGQNNAVIRIDILDEVSNPPRPARSWKRHGSRHAARLKTRLLL